MRDKFMNLKLNFSFKIKKLKKKVGDFFIWVIILELKFCNGYVIYIKIIG